MSTIVYRTIVVAYLAELRDTNVFPNYNERLKMQSGTLLCLSVAAMRFLLIMLLADTVSSTIHIGSIKNCTYVPTSPPLLRFNGTQCDACLCSALLWYNSSFLAMNCYNDGQLCELFSNYSSPFSMLSNRNSTFYFYPSLPPIIANSGRMSLSYAKTFFIVHVQCRPHPSPPRRQVR